MSTSETTKRYFLLDGVRYHPHIDPRTGPRASKVRSADPRSTATPNATAFRRLAFVPLSGKSARDHHACLVRCGLRVPRRARFVPTRAAASSARPAGASPPCGYCYEPPFVPTLSIASTPFWRRASPRFRDRAQSPAARRSDNHLPHHRRLRLRRERQPRGAQRGTDAPRARRGTSPGRVTFAEHRLGRRVGHRHPPWHGELTLRACGAQAQAPFLPCRGGDAMAPCSRLPGQTEAQMRPSAMGLLP